MGQSPSAITCSVVVVLIPCLSVQDHSSGSLLVAEAGGVVSDMNGKPLDFSLGRTLKGNKGVVAAHKDVHQKVIEAVQQAVKESSSEALPLLEHRE